MTGLVLFAIALVCLFLGYSVAFTFAGVSLIVGALTLGIDLFEFMPLSHYEHYGKYHFNGSSYVYIYGDCSTKNWLSRTAT